MNSTGPVVLTSQQHAEKSRRGTAARDVRQGAPSPSSQAVKVGGHR